MEEEGSSIYKAFGMAGKDTLGQHTRGLQCADSV